MDINRQIAQHRAQIAIMRRDALLGGLLLAALLMLTTSAFVLRWHLVIRVLLLIPTLGMLFHAAAPYTRMSEHRRKLKELEMQRGSARD